MKKTIAIFFLLSFLISQNGQFIIYYIQRLEIKRLVREELLAGIDNRFLEVIAENENVIWEEEGEEFSLHGDFYDVIKIEQSGDKTLLYCVSDKNEGQLIQNYARDVKSTQSGKNSKQSSKFSISDEYLFAEIEVAPLMHICVPAHSNFKEYLSAGRSDIIIPPPRM